jgi:hypothetical protein
MEVPSNPHEVKDMFIQRRKIMGRAPYRGRDREVMDF